MILKVLFDYNLISTLQSFYKWGIHPKSCYNEVETFLYIFRYELNSNLLKIIKMSINNKPKRVN